MFLHTNQCHYLRQTVPVIYNHAIIYDVVCRDGTRIGGKFDHILRFGTPNESGNNSIPRPIKSIYNICTLQAIYCIIHLTPANTSINVNELNQLNPAKTNIINFRYNHYNIKINRDYLTLIKYVLNHNIHAPLFMVNEFNTGTTNPLDIQVSKVKYNLDTYHL